MSKRKYRSKGVKLFSRTYAEARTRFRAAAQDQQARLQEIEHPLTGINGEKLAIDVASWGEEQSPARTLLLSSGLHGAEGYFGSAVQLALIHELSEIALPEGFRLVLVHALNPWGFSHLRRADHENIDCNRNFLLPDQEYSGSHLLYPQLDPFLNPPRQPRGIDGFYLQALKLLRKHGMQPLQQAIASGQFDFPQGLFFGGHQPAWTNQQFQQHWLEWTGEAAEVWHFDLHTGLGRFGSGRCLVDYELETQELKELQQICGEEAVEVHHATSATKEVSEDHKTEDEKTLVYLAQGGIGNWCRQQYAAGRYTYGCLEFGTFPPLRVLKKLRLENQAHFYCPPDSRKRIRFKRKLRRMFCPYSRRWRRHTVEQALQWIQTAINPLAQE